MFDGIKQTAAVAAKKTAYSTVGGILMAIGIGFLTSAAWIFISLELGPLMASGLIGIAYLGLGFIFMAIASMTGPKQVQPDPRPAHAYSEPPPRPDANMPGLVQAFMYGMDAGAQAKRNR